MAWLKVDQTIRDHHKILDAADLLQTTDAHVTGCLVLLWLWAIDNAPDGSYDWNTEANGLLMDEKTLKLKILNDKPMPVMADYDNFHLASGGNSAKNWLYLPTEVRTTVKR